MRGTCRTYVNTSWSLVPKISVGCDGLALVIVLNEAGTFPANLGGITGPGSRPKGQEPGFFNTIACRIYCAKTFLHFITGGIYYDSMGRIEGQRPDCPGNR